MNSKIKKQLAHDIHAVFAETVLDFEKIQSLLEKPKDNSMGQMSLPVFMLAKELKKAPPQIASEYAQKIQGLGLSYLQSCEAVSGFINFKFSSEFLMLELQSLLNMSQLGHSDQGKGQRLVIDYSSPNVAKPMNIGHLRATVIGQAIRNLAQTQGFEVVGLNHLGDWGVQFGKLAWAYQQWSKEYDFAGAPFKSLFDMYVRFHDEAEKNPEYDEHGAATFRKLEAGDPEVTELWKMFVDISLKEYQKLWDRLGVKHDLVKGESFYSDQLEETIKKIEAKEILQLSQGAYVVDVGEDMPPCLIKKSDGASLYATRDLASAIYRHDVLKCDVNLYVVGVDQTLHFKQVFKVLEMMGYEWAKQCHHISFGMYRFKNIGKMSTRKGRAIFLEDVLNKSVELAKEIIEEKNPELKNKDQVSEQVGVGAIIFNDLINDRVRDVDFDWDRILDFEGDSGPYIQYSAVRCKSVLRKYRTDKNISDADFNEQMQNFDVKNLKLETEEVLLSSLLLSYGQVLTDSYDKFKPSILASYVLDVAKTYNSFYNKLRILTAEDPKDIAKRVYLTYCASQVLTEGLGILNIQTPEEM